MIKLVVNKRLNNKSKEVVIKLTVLLETILDLKQISLTQMIYLITFSLVMKFLRDMATKISVVDLNNNTDNKLDNHRNKKRGYK